MKAAGTSATATVAVCAIVAVVASRWLVDLVSIGIICGILYLVHQHYSQSERRLRDEVKDLQQQRDRLTGAYESATRLLKRHGIDPNFEERDESHLAGRCVPMASILDRLTKR